MSLPLLSMVVGGESEVVAARQRARHVAEIVGFDHQDQTRIATAVSEIARNAVRYAGGGRVTFAIEGETPPQVLTIVVADHGPGIPHLADVLGGRYRSERGLGLGIAGSRRLMDRFTIDAAAGGGTTVMMGKLLPPLAPALGPETVPALTASIGAAQPQDALAETLQQNRELLRALDDLRRRQDELQRLNRELEDTNRGVVALYAELDERADHLRRADEMKSKFLSNMSHEFRTPLNSMLALTRLLLDRADGDLTPEQETQVRLVQKSAQDLSELVNDLLDLAKVEAGKIVVHPADFEVAALFGALRGMLRPLLVGDHVDLVFEIDGEVPLLHTDEAKVSQILRNFISNALKFTEAGAVRVSARHDRASGTMHFAVADTGIGIAPEDHERIFQEFSQVENRTQRTVRGTGLGLPLSRRLAELLGGRIELTSQLGVGSTFTVVLPAVYQGSWPAPAAGQIEPLDPDRTPVVVLEDAIEEYVIYERLLRGSPFQPVFARTPGDAHEVIERMRPAVLVLDLFLHGEAAWPFLADLRRREATAALPVLIASAVDERQKGLALGADAYLVKPLTRDQLIDQLAQLARHRHPPCVLVVDDDPAMRYLLRRLLSSEGVDVVEAADGVEGVRLAIEHRPAAIVLDLAMPRLNGVDALAQLRTDLRTSGIPVVMATSTAAEEVRARLGAGAPLVLSKAVLRDANPEIALRRTLEEAGLRLHAAPHQRHVG